MKRVEIEVNDRLLLLGLDEMYRDVMKTHESGELLGCARAVASELNIVVKDCPIEGYYTESEELTEYFKLMRTLQEEPDSKRTELQTSNAASSYARLYELTSSPIYGNTGRGMYLFPRGEDVLYRALAEVEVTSWNKESLVNAAYRGAKENAEFSLVALAALAKDGVVLTALRETVVLYAAVAVGAAMMEEPEYVYRWNVSPELENRAKKFAQEFNRLFHEKLPIPQQSNAAIFSNAAANAYIEGRCVCIGKDDRTLPIKYYHWAINGAMEVEEFWSEELWTTERYREKSYI